MRGRAILTGAIGAMFCAPSGCALQPTSSGEPAEDTTAVIEPIINGTQTTAYPEATLLNMRGASGASYACSAVLVAPRVVMTAGHCVDGMVSWSVSVNGTQATSARGETFDWHENGAANVNPNHHDIGLVYLDQPIQVPSFPVLALSPLKANTPVVDVGRILNGALTNSFYKAPLTVNDGAALGYPFDYYGTDVIEHGDSGGPVFLPSTHTIVAVNSGANGSIEVLARVDPLSTWIAQRVAANGGAPDGGGAVADAGLKPADAGAAADVARLPEAGPIADAGPKPTDAGSSADVAHVPEAGPIADAGMRADAPIAQDGSAPSKPAVDAGTKPEGGATCALETEPNDTVASATRLAASQCGSLATPTDVDWYVVVATSGTTRVQLTASADASLAVGYLTPAGTCSVVIPASAGAVGVSITVGGQAAAVSVCASVSSSGRKVQSYSLAVARQ